MADQRRHCAEHAGHRSDCEACMHANYRFEAEEAFAWAEQADKEAAARIEALLDENAKLKAERDMLRETLDELDEDRRRAFIHDAVQLLYIYGRRGPAGHNSVSREEAWEAARALWDAKPEDC